MRASHLIIEGPDGSGKTTLARALCATGYAYRHEGPPPPNVRAVEYYSDTLTLLLRPTLLDRFHLGELVYGPLLRGKSGLSPNDMVLLRQQTRDMGVHIILCLPPVDVAFRNWTARGQAGKELFTNPDLFISSYSRFYDLRHEADAYFDYTRDSVDLDRLTTLGREPWRHAS